MRVLTALVIVLAVLGAAAQSPVPITSNPLAAPIEKRGLAVEIRGLARACGHARHAPRKPGRDSGGPSTHQLRPRPAGWAPFRQRLARLLYVLDRNNQPSLYVDVAAVFLNGAYTALAGGFTGFAFHPGFAKNGLLAYTACRARDGRYRRALHPARIHDRGCDPPQRHHRVARDQSRQQHVRGRQARAAARRPCGQQPDASFRASRVQSTLQAG